MPPKEHNDDNGCVSSREMDRVYEALNQVHAAMRDLNEDLKTIRDQQNGQSIKLGMVLGGCILAATLIPILVVFIEKAIK